MNINRHNYEEYILEYLEGTLTPETQAALEAFLANNPDVADEISALAAGMPILTPDTTVVYARKNELKKPENPKTVAFWGNNRERFFVLSLAAAFILFALGWWVISSINTLETQSGPAPLAQQTTAPAAPATATTSGSALVNSGNINPATPSEPVLASVTKPVRAGMGQQKQQAARGAVVTSTNGQTSGNKMQGLRQVASMQSVNPPVPAVSHQELTRVKTVVAPPIPSKQAYAIAAATGQTLPPALALQQVEVSAQANPQLLAHENTAQSKALRAIGKLLFNRKPNRRLPHEENGSETLIAQLTNSIIPEAYRETTEPIDASINFSLAVSPGTHRVLRDLLNR